MTDPRLTLAADAHRTRLLALVPAQTPRRDPGVATIQSDPMAIADRVWRQIGSDPSYGRGPRWRTCSTSGYPTDQQSTARQNLLLAEAEIEVPVVFEENPDTSSRLRPPQRPKFRELLTYARPGGTVHISEMFRLVRGTGHILDMLDVLHRDLAAPRIHDGALSAMDLTARHPRTGEPQPTVKFTVQTLAAGELQRDLQRERTYDGLPAAAAKGSKSERRPAVPAGKTDTVRTAYLDGRSIAALARTASAAAPFAPPSLIFCPSTRPPTRTPRLRSCRSSSTCRARSPTSSAPPNWSPSSAARSTRVSPYGAARDCTLRISTTPEVHRQLLARCQPLDGAQGAPTVPGQHG